MSEITVRGRGIPFAKESPDHGGTLAHPTLIVLHSTGGAFQGAWSWMMKKDDTYASAHFLVSRTGEIQQLVSLHHIAYHAGVSSYNGKANCNTFSIGIEMEHLDGKQDWPDMQLLAVAALCKELQRQFGISHIVGHRDVAPGRKVDPLKFPWDTFRAVLGKVV